MKRKILNILLWAGIILLSLIFAVFVLTKFGVIVGVFIFIAIAIAAHYLISSGTVFFQPRSKNNASGRKKKKGRRSLPMIQGLGGLSYFMKSGARVIESKADLPTFNDVAGCDEAKELLKEVVDILKHPHKFQKIGKDVRIPKGALLTGPPGTGKTLLARATAGEAGVSFLSINGSEFVEMIVGTAAARVRDLFNTARALSENKNYRGAIIFIDEIDAIGKSRGSGGLSGANDEREQALNQILAEMDGFDKDTNIVVMAATNRPDVLDSALKRKGRFDRIIAIDLPDKNGRWAILKIHTRNKKLAQTANLEDVARATPGFSGADLENLANEAALSAAKQNKKEITTEDFLQAIDVVTIGPKRKSKIISKSEKEIIAYHEAGHALVAAFSPKIEPLQKISIIPTGAGVGGYTKLLPEEDKYLYTKEYLFAGIQLLLGGRAAEEIVFGKEKISTGAANDLKKATELIRKIICEWGMSDLGPQVFEKGEEGLFWSAENFGQKKYSNETAKEIDQELKKILNQSYKKTQELLMENRSKLDALAKALLLSDELEREEILKIIK